MKCPRCNYEREQDFRFCPLCGNPMNLENNNYYNYYPNYTPTPPQYPNPPYQSFGPQPPYQPINPNPQPVQKANYGLTEQTYNEKKGIKRLARISGGAFLTLLFISGVFATVLFYILYFYGLDPQKIYDWMKDPFVSQFLQITISSFMFLIPFTLFFKISKHKISELINFSLPKGKTWFAMILLGIGFCAFANIATSFLANFFAGLGIDYEVDFGEDPKGPLGIALSVIATAIVPALVEEYACRGLVLGSLRKYGDGFAVMVSAILFGLIHGNFQQIPFAFMVGLILGFVTVKCESIWPAVFIHFYNNLSSVIFTYAFDGVAIPIQNLIYTAYLMVCLLLGLVGILLLKKHQNIFKLAPSETESTEKQKYTWFFTTEMTIIVVVLCLLGSLQYFK